MRSPRLIQEAALRNAISLLLGELFLLMLFSCEITTSAKLGSGPSFSLDGSGHLVSFTVYAPQPRRKIATPNDAKSEVWSFRASSNSRGELVVRMNLLYGKVPTGYLQTTPKNGAPSALTPGLVYYFFAETTGAAGAEGFFYMDKTGPIRIAVPGLCSSAFVGDVKAVKCGTNEPYIEPREVEQFVRGNRFQN
jgi:hypothetical protein